MRFWHLLRNFFVFAKVFARKFIFTMVSAKRCVRHEQMRAQLLKIRYFAKIFAKRIQLGNFRGNKNEWIIFAKLNFSKCRQFMQNFAKFRFLR